MTSLRHQPQQTQAAMAFKKDVFRQLTVHSVQTLHCYDLLDPKGTDSCLLKHRLLFHVRFNLDLRVRAKVNFPQFLFTHGRDNAHYEQAAYKYLNIFRFHAFELMTAMALRQLAPPHCLILPLCFHFNSVSCHGVGLYVKNVI